MCPPEPRPAVERPPGRTARRRARAALASGVVSFAAATVAFGLGVEGATAFYDPAHTSKERKLLAARDTIAGPTVVFFGSSRIQSGVDAARAEASLRSTGREAVVFSFGVAGGGALRQAVVEDRLAEVGVDPDFAVYEVLPGFVHDDPKGPPESPWLDARRLSKRERTTWDVASPGLGPWAERRHAILVRTLPSFVPDAVRFTYADPSDKRGAHLNPNEPFEPALRAKLTRGALATYAPVLAVLTPGGRAGETLRERVAARHRRGLATAVVVMPEGTDFRNAYGPGAEGRFREFLHSLEAPVIDARTWVPDEFFIDGHHLLHGGAERFTDRFTAEVLKPWLREARP